MVTEAEARKIIGKDGAQTLVEIIEGAWQDHVDEDRRRSPSTRASIVWDYMTQRADGDLVDGFEGVDRIERHERPLYVLQNRLILGFKKHTGEMLTRNYPTASQQALNEQGAFDGLPWPHVSCGYVLDKADAGIDQLLVVRRVGKKVEWFIPLRELADGVIEPLAPILWGPTAGDSLAELPSIRKRAKTESGTE